MEIVAKSSIHFKTLNMVQRCGIYFQLIGNEVHSDRPITNSIYYFTLIGCVHVLPRISVVPSS